MRILVTGHEGYIGTVLVPMLRSGGHEVVGLDTGLFLACTFGPSPVPVASMERDIRDVRSEDLAGFDAVIHLAALSNDPLGDLDPELTREINHRAAVRLARLAKSEGVRRFLFSSSCSTYGAAGEEMIDEEASFNPVTPYGATKVAVEHDLSELADESFSPTYLRNATAYGMSPRIRFDLVLNNLTAWAVTTGRVHLKSDGSPWRPLVHVEDIARAFTALLEAPRPVVHDEAFNVGRSDENYQIIELARTVADTVPDCQLDYSDDAGPDERTYRVNFDKIQEKVPSFTPQWTVKEGAQQLYEAYREIGVTLEEFEGPRYKRLAHIQSLMGNGNLDRDLRWREEAVHHSSVAV